MNLIATARGSRVILRLKACYLVLSFHAKGSMEEPYPSSLLTAPVHHAHAVLMLVDFGVRCNVI